MSLNILSYISNLIAGRYFIINLYNAIEKARVSRNNAKYFNYKFSLPELGTHIYNGEELIELDNISIRMNINEIIQYIDPKKLTLDIMIIFLLKGQECLLELYKKIEKAKDMRRNARIFTYTFHNPFSYASGINNEYYSWKNYEKFIEFYERSERMNFFPYMLINGLLPKIFEKIVFTSTRDGTSNIYIMDSNGKNQYNLTNALEEEYNPKWSKDGKYISYLTKLGTQVEIYIMDMNGRYQKRLTNSSNNNIFQIWHPDMDEIIYASDKYGKNKFEIYSLMLNNLDEHKLTGSIGKNILPNIIPNSNEIIFVSTRDSHPEIYKMNYDGSSQYPLTETEDGCSYPKLSPDGKIISYIMYPNKLFIMDTNGLNKKEITDNIYFGDNIRWRSDGMMIAYIGYVNEIMMDIYIYDIRNEEIKRITNLNVEEPEEIKLNSWIWEKKMINLPATETKFLFTITNKIKKISQIYTINIEGNELIKLTNEGSNKDPDYIRIDN
jgi:TolB protein